MPDGGGKASSGVHAPFSIISRLRRRGARRARLPPPAGYRWPNLASSAKRYPPLTKPKHNSSPLADQGSNAIKILTPARVHNPGWEDPPPSSHRRTRERHDG